MGTAASPQHAHKEDEQGELFAKCSFGEATQFLFFFFFFLKHSIPRLKWE